TRPIGIAADASAMAAKTPGANHLTRAGRAKLFEPRYPLAWGDGMVKVDAFLTGVAAVSPDLKKITIGLLIFDREKNNLDSIGKDIEATLKPAALADLGESFLMRGLFDGGKVELSAPLAPEKILEEAVKTRKEVDAHPLKEALAPISLTVYYGK